MESLSDSIAEVESFILTLTTQSFTPEIDGQIRCLNSFLTGTQYIGSGDVISDPGSFCPVKMRSGRNEH